MKLKINEIYKVNEEQDILEEENYSYWVCVGEKEEYFILHEVKAFANNNSLDINAFHETLENTFGNEQYGTLHGKYFKQYNSLEAIYHKTKSINTDKPIIKENSFQIV